MTLTPEEKLQVYLKANSAYQSEAIPGQNNFTFISKLTGFPQAWTVDEQGEPVQFGVFDDRVMSVHHAPQGDKTVLGVDHKGNEKQQLYLMEGTHAATPLVVEGAYFHNFGGWSPAGDKIAFSSNRRHPGYFDVFVQDIETKDVETVYTFDGKCEPLAWLPDGAHLLISIQETNLNNVVLILDLNTGETTQLGDKGTGAAYKSIALTEDGEGGYLVTDLNDETAYVARFSFDNPGHLTKVFQKEGWDVEELKLSPDEQTLIFIVNEGGISRLMVYDVVTKEVTQLEDLADGVVSSLSWIDANRFIFTLKTPVEPGDIWQVSLAGWEISRLTRLGESVSSVPLYEPSLCSFKSFDGLEVPYFYYDKAGASDKPAVVYVHGGPEGQTRADYNPVIQYLTEQGFAVAAPNVRGSSGYGRTYIHLDDVRKRMDSVQDLAWLVQDLIKTHNVGEDKIGIIGRSYGGFMVLAAMTHYPELWAAGVDIVGISHFKTFLENTGAWRRHLRESEYGSLAEDVDFFEEIAPLNHSDKIQAPLLVFHGRNDTRVPVTEAQQLVSDMKNRGQEVELTIFEDEGHQTEKLENHITMHSSTADFFEKHLK
ncbi:Prolyl oligopeptidase [Lentibacillus sp. JNUCC-1]|uniref:S9 family peptidase n=1 Tax=Lentibacillus sp. JNUCC-1 TaxID=2654513 RepID=UPI0012E92F20|nr:S9 family peptidase [Lentibacillus sp. JNUCC-1]MUV37293.1 Prolyl oligopeptidase [Lentibacillus sp. JNUCC-1]